MDAALVRQARAGSEVAFARLVAIHEKPLRGFLRKSGWIDADDIAQEAFVAAWSDLPRLRDDAGFRAWLYGVAWKKALSQRRGAQRAAARDEAWRGEQDLEAAAEVAAEDRLALETALATLPEDQRACVTLCLGQAWSHAEVSDALGIPLGTVKSHVTRGRERPRTAAGGSGRISMTPDDQLSAFLGEQPATSRADLFTAVVMQKIERRAFLRDVAAAGGWAAVVGLVAWACAPVLNVLIGALAPGLAPAAAALALVAATLLVSSPSVRRRLGLAAV